MGCKLSKQLKVLTSLCDNTSKMSIPSVFSAFMDLATEHGNEIGVGTDKLSPKGLFWVTAKTKIKIHKLPEVLECINASTWPEKPGRIRCNRYYTLEKDGEILAEGKTEWAIIDINSGRPCRPNEVYPEGIIHCEDTVCEEAFSKISEDFEAFPVIDTYKVRSTDIDLGQHLNNAVYARILFGAFSCDELSKMNINEVEIHFRNQCYEGENIKIYCRKNENAFEIGMFKEDGTVAATALIR